MKNRIFQLIVFQLTVGLTWVALKLYVWLYFSQASAQQTLSVLFALAAVEFIFSLMSLHNAGGMYVYIYIYMYMYLCIH